jgi:hypothetical protein
MIVSGHGAGQDEEAAHLPGLLLQRRVREYFRSGKVFRHFFKRFLPLFKNFYRLFFKTFPASVLKCFPHRFQMFPASF